MREDMGSAASGTFENYHVVGEHIKKLNSVAVARKQTIPIEQLPLVSEGGANLCR
jgi:hypothetical protein